MEKETTAKVISVSKQKWIKINTKPIRKNSSDSAIYPHIIKISYNVGGKEYIKRKFIGAGWSCQIRAATAAVRTAARRLQSMG